MKKVITLLSILGIVFSSNAQTTAEDFFKTATILSFDTNIKPEQLIGAIIYYKPNDKDNFKYLSLLSLEQMKKYEPVFNNKIVFQTMASKETVASVKYLSFFSSKVGVRSLLEIVLEDVLNYQVPSFTTDPVIKAQTFAYAENLIRKGFIVEYIDNVNYCSLTTRIFTETKIEAAGNYYVSADAKNYGSTTDFNTKRLISLHSININDLITVGTPVVNALGGVSLGGGIAKLGTMASSENGTPKPVENNNYRMVNTIKQGSLNTITGDN